MICRQCGTEIADKALICYRCGTATTEPAFKAPASSQPRRTSSPASLAVSVLAIGLLMLLALYMGRMNSGETPRALSWVAVAIAVAVVIGRAVLRRG